MSTTRWAGAALALLAAAPAAAAPLRLSAAALGGSAQPVAALADYQWDVRPQVAWGAQLEAGTGPFALGLRLWRGRTTQSLGDTGAGGTTVNATSLELVGRARVAAWRGVALEALASGGRLGLGWDPDRVTVAAGGTPIEVSFAPVHEWVAGAGLAVRAPLARDWSMGLEWERRTYALDTAHRSGSAIVLGRDRFGDWNARLALARTWDR
jgi:hypothetical protein